MFSITVPEGTTEATTQIGIQLSHAWSSLNFLQSLRGNSGAFISLTYDTIPLAIRRNSFATDKLMERFQNGCILLPC